MKRIGKKLRLSRETLARMMGGVRTGALTGGDGTCGSIMSADGFDCCDTYVNHCPQLLLLPNTQ
jgi:hypothetical protein